MLIPVRRKVRAVCEFYLHQISDTAVSTVGQAMIQPKTNSSAPSWAGRQRSLVTARERAVSSLRARSARIMRILILVLVILQFVLLGLMLLTGRVEIGGPIIGGVLLIGFGAAQFGR